ncbi:MAG TPA: DUF87 domain-containing protein [Candidatus Pacearchaeota archaeon]|nr:replicative DNA helicase [archaeon BMS3Abin17]HDK41968.1 DUF87 domain-containing protein [Candidatus Pacearchaeota archaeon]HDZ61133.1 DUF87 domain-containing protein [Candidatus Pacearchaeota archaeon]
MPYDIVLGRGEHDKKAFGKRGLTYIGKGYVKMGQYTSLSNKILMDVARSHVILVAGKRGCLTGDSLVFTDKGYKEIKDFNEKEDKILSFNKETKEFEWEKAEFLHYKIDNENLLEITFENEERIKLTKEHPLLTVTGNRLLSLLYVKANELKIGDSILSHNLKPIKIVSIKEISGVKEVFDLSVDKNHSFIANGIISHNSGKSYTLGVIAEELSSLPKEVSQNIASLIFDTMGIYWTMKFQNEKDRTLLQEWKLKPKNLPARIFVPFGHYDAYLEKGIPIDEKFALDIAEMNIDDWILTFGLDIVNPVAVLIERTITKLKKQEYFNIKDIIQNLEADEKTSTEIKNAAVGLFEAADTWGIFSRDNKKSTQVDDLISAGKTTILDLSVYNSVGAFNVRALVISLISRKIFSQRMDARKKEEIESVNKGLDLLSGQEKKEHPLIWIFIDEAHEFLPLNSKTIATDALIQLLREGRQPGLSLVLATQQPGQIHRDVMTQSDIVISHRVTSQPDLEALNKIMQSYLLESIKQYMDELPSLKGSAIVLDDNSERIYPIRVRPRFTWHGGEAPTAIKEEKGL